MPKSPKTDLQSSVRFVSSSRGPLGVPPAHIYETYAYQNLPKPETSHVNLLPFASSLVTCCSQSAVRSKQSGETNMGFVTLPRMTSAGEAMAAAPTVSASGREGGREALHAVSTAWRQQQEHQYLQQQRKRGTRRLLLLSPHAASRALTTSAASAAISIPIRTIMTTTARVPCPQHRSMFRGSPSLSMAVDSSAELHAADHATGQAAAAAAAAAAAGAPATAHTAVAAEVAGVQAGAVNCGGEKPGGSRQGDGAS